MMNVSMLTTTARRSRICLVRFSSVATTADRREQLPISETSMNTKTKYNLVFVRHGQSTWNRDNRFIGWTDTPLTDDGVVEATVAGQMLQKSGILFDEVHTSLLRRSIRTVNLCLMETGQEYLPVYKSWRLNERNYGDLVGRNKKEAVHKHGVDQVKRWRRSYDEPPPPMSDDHEFHPSKDPRYQGILDQIPKSESLKCTADRSSVYWDEVIAPSLKEGKTLLVVGHENNLRSIIMKLEDIPKEDIINLSLPRAVPLAYRLDTNLKPLDRPDGKLDEATGYLRGSWIGGDKAVKDILDRDHKQVYDVNIQENLETTKDKFRTWVDLSQKRHSDGRGCTVTGHLPHLGEIISSSSYQWIGINIITSSQQAIQHREEGNNNEPHDGFARSSIMKHLDK